jgi:hypothetical protein
MLQIGAMAEFERSPIQERVKAGLRNVRAKGKKFGSPASRLMPSAWLSYAATAFMVSSVPNPQCEQGERPAIRCPYCLKGHKASQEPD